MTDTSQHITVIKLGGRTLDHAARNPAIFTRLTDLAQRQKVILVPSAIHGVSDQLLLFHQNQGDGQLEPESFLEFASGLHDTVLKQLNFKGPQTTRDHLEHAISIWRHDLANLQNEPDQPLYHRDLAAAFGELSATCILAHVLHEAGLKPTFVDPGDHFQTSEPSALTMTPAFIETSGLRSLNPQCGTPLLFPGFLARAKRSRHRTTLGRNSSDLSAALVARDIGAKRLEIWTHSRGFLSADPAFIRAPITFPEVPWKLAQIVADTSVRGLHRATLPTLFETETAVSLRSLLDLSITSSFERQSSARVHSCFFLAVQNQGSGASIMIHHFIADTPQIDRVLALLPSNPSFVTSSHLVTDTVRQVQLSTAAEFVVPLANSVHEHVAATFVK